MSEDGVPYDEATINNNLSTIKWTDTLKQSLRRGHGIEFDESRIREVLYRPFTKLWLYEDDRILSSVKTVSRMFGKNGGGVSSSPAQTTGPSSPRWPRNRSRISARPEQTSHAELSPAADDTDYRPHEPDDLRGDDNATAAGPPRPGSFDKTASEKVISAPPPPDFLFSRTQQSLIMDPTVQPLPHGKTDARSREGIMISGTANMEFQTLATWTICDLAAIAGSRQTRVMIRQS